jgi:hypothetical protein
MSQGIVQGWSFVTSHAGTHKLRVEVTNLDEQARRLVLAGTQVQGTPVEGTVTPAVVELEGLGVGEFFVEFAYPLAQFLPSDTLRVHLRSEVL